MIEFSTKVERTKILPLRWIGNSLNYVAVRSLIKAFDLQDQDNLGYRFKFHSKVWKHFNKPYMKWGTYYEIDMEAWENS